MTTTLIISGTSEIGLAIARIYAQKNHHLILTARDPARLQTDLADLQHRGAASAKSAQLDILQYHTFTSFIDNLNTLPDIVICAAGLLGNQSTAERNIAEAKTILDTNFTGPILLLNELANRMEARGSGTIIGISSVAGDRGRASNAFYCAAKAGFTAFLSGLRNRLADKNVHVLTVKPGFVDTRMTAHLKLPKLITAQPEDIAAAIVNAAEHKANTIYTYRIWWLIMLIIKHIPEPIFKKLKL